jgi:hypothetical protein
MQRTGYLVYIYTTSDTANSRLGEGVEFWVYVRLPVHGNVSGILVRLAQAHD